MKITRVRSILTAPDGIALVVVKVETDQDGLMAWAARRLASAQRWWHEQWTSILRRDARPEIGRTLRSV
jgi:hypothetical protein